MIGPEDYLRRIPFAAASVAEVCTEPGSYKRELAERVAESIRVDIEAALALLAAAKKGAAP